MKCFLDRDGVINTNYPYVGTINRFEWCPHIIEILQTLTHKGYELIMITNQSGINRGYYTYKDFIDLSFYIHNKLWENGLEIEINYCRHTPEENCKCRKPKTGMMDKYKITIKDILVGDKETDINAANNKGIQNRWLLNPNKLDCPYTRHFKNHDELKEAVYMLK